MAKIKLKISAQQLKDKLKIKDGKTPIKGVDYFDGKNGETPVIPIDAIVATSVKRATQAIENKIPTLDTILNELPARGEVFRDGLELLKGNNRLDYSAIKNTPAIKIDGYNGTGSPAGALRIDGANTPITNISWGGYKITNLATPTSDYDASTKKYVDDSVSVENLWDRTLTTLSPHNAGDSLDMGTGNILTTGTIGAGKLGLGVSPSSTYMAYIVNTGGYGIRTDLNQNGVGVVLQSYNTNTGADAVQSIGFGNGTANGNFYMYGSGYNHSSVAEANEMVFSNSLGQITFQAINNNIMFATSTSGSRTERWRIDGATGNLSNTGSAGTAYLHLKAGTATAGTAPLKFTAGTLLATPEAGTIQYTTGAFNIVSDRVLLGGYVDDGTSLLGIAGRTVVYDAGLFVGIPITPTIQVDSPNTYSYSTTKLDKGIVASSITGTDSCPTPAYGYEDFWLAPKTTFTTVGFPITASIVSGYYGGSYASFYDDGAGALLDFGDFHQIGTINYTTGEVDTTGYLSDTIDEITYIYAGDGSFTDDGANNLIGSVTEVPATASFITTAFPVTASSISGSDSVYGPGLYDDGLGNIYNANNDNIATIVYSTGVVTDISGGTDTITSITYNAVLATIDYSTGIVTDATSGNYYTKTITYTYNKIDSIPALTSGQIRATGSLSVDNGLFLTNGAGILTFVGGKTANATTLSNGANLALGFEAVASAAGATALGSYCVASGANSFSAGYQSSSPGFSGISFGQNCTSSGNRAFSAGSTCVSSGIASISIGGSCTSYGNFAFSAGTYAKSYGQASIAGGYAYQATLQAGDGTANSGYGQIALGYASTGQTLKAEKTGSVAIGQDVQALTNVNVLVFGRAFTSTVQDSFNVGFGQVDFQVKSGLVTSYGGRIKKTRRVTGTTDTVLSTDETVFYNTTSNAIAVALPAGVEGTHYVLINTGSVGKNVTITPNGTEKINGDASQILYDGEVYDITYNATDGWWG